MQNKFKQIKNMLIQILHDYNLNNSLNKDLFENVLSFIENSGQEEIDFKELVDNIDESIFLTDKNGFVIYTNPAYSRNTGVSPEDVMHKYVHDIIAAGVFSGGSVIPVLQTQKKAFRLSTTYCSDPPRLGYTVGVPIFDDKGELKQVVVSSRPILSLTALRENYSKFLSAAKSFTDEITIIDNFDPKISRKLFHDSAEMNTIWQLIHKAAPTDATVLITGETGVGKEVIADEIYRLSSRSHKPFIKINCAAIPANLLESELFGYEKGAFSGASTQGKKGLLELAHQGTILFDEIGDMPLDLQAKLLRAIQSKEIMRLGGKHPIILDIRFIASTNCDLKQKAATGEFRQDLYYRLKVIPIHIPPLRKRPQEIASLCQYFLQQYTEKYHSQITLNPRQLDWLKRYAWPGNVRELENVLEYLAICCAGSSELDDAMLQGLLDIETSNDAVQSQHVAAAGMDESRIKLEKELIEEALSKTSNLRQAGKLLKISAPTLCRKIKQYQIHYPRSKTS